ncbi:hypothetical protein CXF68_14830 [Tenacibaculum sp. Bg11-29]|uniref:hypothetical protein n=1 Tax=Tenacibaculum sp. Bg11-29 TaxID=2058306 RepID=UPI000C336F03|nr:hypothetical protein [Tenacibaculum sp. Bg11-29]PKH51882.1 hypothetical protein CXF68_14830 [Tenacibaculum sp. Bg11-29]
MGIKIFKSKLSEFKNDPYARFDVDYLDLYKSFFNLKQKKYLNDFITFIETGKSITKEDYNNAPSEYAHIVVRNIKNGELKLSNLVYLNEDKGEDLAPFRLKKDDILIAISSNVGSSCIIDQNYDINLTLSHYIARIRVDENKINKNLLVHYLNSKLIQEYFRCTETGKTLKNLSKTYIHRLPIILPSDIDLQKEIVNQIKPIEKSIKKLKTRQDEDVNIINRVLGEELNLDIDKFEKLKTENKFGSNLKEFSNNIDCRFSFKFHNKAGQFVWDFLFSKTNKRIKDFISEPIVLGKSVSPKDYDNDGDYYYIAMSSIKTWAFDPEGCKTVSNTYSKANKNKSVQKDDIILARSGEGTIGKVALIEDEEIDAIHADFTQRIRLTNYNARLAYYYMRSDLFQYLVYTHKKGLGNNTNIFPSQVQEFPIPDWEETKQTELVDKIKTQIDAQKEIDKQITKKQAEISAIIEKAIQTE